jgi:hypothetical protein
MTFEPQETEAQVNFELQEDEYLTRCVVNTTARTFSLYSNTGDEKVVSCDTVTEFMNVLTFVRNTVDESTLVYADPLIAG